MAILLGIDLGTSSLKVAAMEENGTLLTLFSQSYQFDSPINGYGEQNPDVWWKACCHCLQLTVAKLGSKSKDIAGIGFSGQMHGAVFLDKSFTPVRPAILHTDSRSSPQVEEIQSLLGAKWIENHLFNPIYTGFLLPSLLWVRQNEPHHYQNIHYLMLPKDYLRLCLCGEWSSDYSDASATLAFDIQKLCWSAPLLHKLNLSPALFPACTSSHEQAGKVTTSAASQTGLTAGTKVMAGGGDAIMQAVGNGVILPGQATANIGTSGQIAFQTKHPVKNPQLNTNTFCSYASHHWITMGATMSAGLSMKWFGSLFPQMDYAQQDIDAALEPPGSGGLLFFPYLTGERTPHLNPNISGMFWGITTNTSRAKIARAVMEGVCYSLRESLELCSGLGLQASQLVASGGGAHSQLWLQIQADVFGLPVKVAKLTEHACIGAAITAGVGAGLYSSLSEGCTQVVGYQPHIYEPNPGNHQIYNHYFALYRQSYQAAKQPLEALTLLGRSGIPQ